MKRIQLSINEMNHLMLEGRVHILRERLEGIKESDGVTISNNFYQGCDMISSIREIGRASSVNLRLYVHESPFKDVKEWVDSMEDRKNGVFFSKLYLYRIEKLDNSISSYFS